MEAKLEMDFIPIKEYKITTTNYVDTFKQIADDIAAQLDASPEKKILLMGALYLYEVRIK